MENEKKEIRQQANYRISAETKERLKELAAKSGLTSDELFNTMADSFELAAFGSQNVKREAEITRFQQYLNALQNLYRTSLDQWEIADENARSLVQKEMQEKDDRLGELVSKIRELKKQQEQLQKEWQEKEKNCHSLLDQKDLEIRTLKKSLAGNETALKHYDILTQDNRRLNEALGAAREKTAGLEAENAALRAERDRLSDLLHTAFYQGDDGCSSKKPAGF